MANIAFVLSVLAVAALFGAIKTVHRVDEGHVGVMWRAGRLVNTTSHPGIYFVVPFLEVMENMQVTMQTDSVFNIPCGTSGGVMIEFGRVEVVNRLKDTAALNTVRHYGVDYDKMWIFDKIHHEINQFCSTHTLREVYIDKFDTLDENLAETLQSTCDKFDTGVDIIAVRVTKPRVPEALRRDFEQAESERAALLLSKERLLVVEQQAHNAARKETIEAEKTKRVREIELAKEVMEKEAAAKISAIEDGMALAKAKAATDAAFYRVTKEAVANEQRLTKAFLQYTMYTAVANGTKMFFGEKIPSMFAGNWLQEEGAVKKQ
jgi:regulator of protease activity HflC (stomatin/prohibitin superfamily)